MRLWYWLLAPAFGFLSAGNAVAQIDVETVAQCHDTSKPDLSKDACTAIINSRGEAADSLSEALFYRGTLYWRKGQYDQAIDDFDHAIALKPSAGLFGNLGFTHTALGQYDKAIADFSEGIKLNPDTNILRMGRGRAYLRKGELDNAIADFYEAIKLAPDFAEVFVDRGTAYQAKHDSDHAITDFEKAIRLNPNIAEAHFGLGNVYLAKQDYDQAIADYSEAIRLSPQFLEAFNNRGNAYLAKRDYDQAIADYSEAIRLSPSFSAAFNNRGFAYFLLGKFDEAGKDSERLLALDQTNAYAPLWSYLALARTGQKGTAELSANALRIDHANWPGAVFDLYLGKKTSDQVRVAANSGDAKTKKNQSCEAAFYIAEFELLSGDAPVARASFKEAVDTCPHTFREYSAAIAELMRLAP